MSKVEICPHSYNLAWSNMVCPDCLAEVIGITLPSGKDRGEPYHIGPLELVSNLKKENAKLKSQVERVFDAAYFEGCPQGRVKDSDECKSYSKCLTCWKDAIVNDDKNCTKELQPDNLAHLERKLKDWQGQVEKSESKAKLLACLAYGQMVQRRFKTVSHPGESVCTFCPVKGSGSCKTEDRPCPDIISDWIGKQLEGEKS
jgi:hypothetical protein